MHLYIIRHGESLGNIEQTDDPNCNLSPRGEQQVQSILPYFEKIDIGMIFSSPLKRTIQSATVLAKKKGLQIGLIPELSESFDHKRKVYGDHDWDNCDEIVRQNPNTFFVERVDPKAQWWPVWPETGDDVKDRVTKLYEADLRPHLHTDAHIVVFGHGATTRRLRKLVCAENQQNNEHGSDNAVICAYHLDGNGQCQDYEVYIDHIKDCMSAKMNRAY